MDKELFKEYSQHERIEMFESNADGVEERVYFEELTEQELIERKSRFAQRSIEAARIEDRKKEAMEDFKAELEPVKKEKLNLAVYLKWLTEVRVWLVSILRLEPLLSNARQPEKSVAS